MVAAANPLATESGFAVLRAGGSAVDAAIAVQLALALVEPQSSGIGGGALMLTWSGRRVQAWDGRETAPAAAREDHFLDAQGRPVPLQQAMFGGRAVATPGAVRMLELAHAQLGRLPWADLFEPAIRLAEDGFAMGPRLHRLLQIDPWLRQDPQARALYYQADGTPWPVGHRLRNPAMGQLLRRLAREGSQALHEGAVARSIAAAVRAHPVPGVLSEADLGSYRAIEREPICTLWLTRLRVCGFPPPSSGHLTMMQILGMLQALDLRGGLQEGVPSAAWLHHYSEAARLAHADRALYIADPGFVAPPAGRWDSLLDGRYLAQRSGLIGPQAATRVEAGTPEADSASGETAVPIRLAIQGGPWAPMPEQVERGTSHISVVDGQGQAVSLTTTIEAQFGARVMVDGGTGLAGGFLLNNQMTDFSLAPRDSQGRAVANRVQPLKRPRSSMSPTLVFDAQDGRLLMSLGSPGGGMIIHFTAKTLVATQQWGLDVQKAISLPNFVQVSGPLLLEKGRFPAALKQSLQALGHRVEERELTSGIQAIERTSEGWFGGADPRREGVVRAD